MDWNCISQYSIVPISVINDYPGKIAMSWRSRGADGQIIGEDYFKYIHGTKGSAYSRFIADIPRGTDILRFKTIRRLKDGRELVCYAFKRYSPTEPLPTVNQILEQSECEFLLPPGLKYYCR